MHWSYTSHVSHAYTSHVSHAYTSYVSHTSYASYTSHTSYHSSVSLKPSIHHRLLHIHDSFDYFDNFL